MGGIGRADDFAVGGVGFGGAGDVGFALLGGEAGEVGDVLVPLAGGGPGVVSGDVEVGLDEDGGVGGCGFGGRDGYADGANEQEGDAGDSEGATTGAGSEQDAAGDQGVDDDEDEADSVDAGEGGELVDEGVVDLGVAELVPGDGGDAGGGEFKSGPEDGRGGEREAVAVGGFADEGDAEGEEAEVEPEDSGVSDEEKDGDDGGQVTIFGHGVANPVAVAHVPEEAAEVAKEEAAAKGAGLVGDCGAKNRVKERDEAEPGEG